MDENEEPFRSLKRLDFEKPPFVHASSNPFPHHWLNASLASWSVITAKAFISTVFQKLEVESPLSGYEKWLDVPKPVKSTPK
jgi:hypothetical protein